MSRVSFLMCPSVSAACLPVSQRLIAGRLGRGGKAGHECHVERGEELVHGPGQAEVGCLLLKGPSADLGRQHEPWTPSAVYGWSSKVKMTFSAAPGVRARSNARSTSKKGGRGG
jgi:hypothetical protein